MKWVKTLWTCSIVHFHHIIPINRYPPIITNVYINNSCILATLPIFHLPAVRTWFGQDHGFILDGCYAHILSKSGISICRWHLVTHRKSRQIRFFFGNYLFYTCATCSEQPSYICTMASEVNQCDGFRCRRTVSRFKSAHNSLLSQVRVAVWIHVGDGGR